ncbi:MAG: pyridoxal phosphate-dependent aminotransferase [Planctomycetes bacterium]|nr:pyridoxal phosphate-dependent aminotransferase [Planctomycetota bacterium]
MFAIPLSQTARSITDSITLAITARAKAMRAEGLDVVSLGAGEPDFPTPTNIADAGVAAIRDGYTRYTAAAGMPEVRAAAARWFGRHFGLDYRPEQIVVTAGAKPALTLGLTAIVERGDRVLLPAPYWPSYPDIVRLAGGVPVPLAARADQGFVHTGEQIAAAARQHGCKGAVINFPNNPSGAVPSRTQVEDILRAAQDTGMWLVSDEIYARLIYEGEHVSPASLPGGAERTIVVNGGTKSHSMTGWRVGFLAAPPEVAAAVARIQSQALGNTCSISQRAALTVADETDDTELAQRLAAFDKRRRYLVEVLNATPRLQLDLPNGAFYALLDVRDICASLGLDDVALAERLLVEGLVATVPGSAFEVPGFIRLSYAASMADLEKAVERIRGFVAAVS